MALRLIAHRRVPVTLEGAFGERNVALFDPRMERSYEPLLNRLRMQDLSLPALDLLVLRGSHPETFEEIEGDDALAAYLDGIPVAVLSGSHIVEDPRPTLRSPEW